MNFEYFQIATRKKGEDEPLRKAKVQKENDTNKPKRKRYHKKKQAMAQTKKSSNKYITHYTEKEKEFLENKQVKIQNRHIGTHWGTLCVDRTLGRIQRRIGQ